MDPGPRAHIDIGPGLIMIWPLGLHYYGPWAHVFMGNYENSDLLVFTEAAANKVKTLIEEEKNDSLKLRVFVSGGGCSGFQYDFSYDNKISDDDLVQHNILIDKQSVELLKGSEIDYADELIGESFKITNPQTKSSCGCGVSFSL